MKRLLGLALVVIVAGGGLYLAQRRRQADQVSANAVLDIAADVQRDVSRVPMQLTRLPDDEEVRIGDQIASDYPAGELDAEQRANEQYVETIGARVAAHAHRKLAYHFHLVADHDLINAFAVPGGHVFIGQGLLDIMTSEDEVAFVLGHEIEHIDHYHPAERVQVEAHMRKLHLGILGELAQMPAELWQVGYSKDEEAEADREGLRIACAAGYSAQGALNLLDRFEHLHREYVIRAETPVDELSQIAVQGLTGYFRSHPLPSERMAQARTIIATDKLPLDRKLTPFRIEYEVTASTP